MESDNESFNLEDLPMFLNSVLEKTQLICREENVDFEHSGNRSRVQNSGRLPAIAGTLATLAGDFSPKK